MSKNDRFGAPGRAGWMVLALLVVLHAALAWWGRQPGVLTGQDDAEYIALSQSVATGSYRSEYLVGSPAHAQYPPGYPALLAGWSAVTGEGFDALVALSVVLSAAMLVLLYVALRERVGPTVGLAVVAVLAVNPQLLRFAGRVMSESAYAFLAVVALMLAGVAGRWVYVAAAAGVAALLTRSVGITVVAALAVYWLLERRWWPLAWLTVPAVLAAGGWLWWSAQAPEQYMGASYVAELRSIEGGLPWVAPLPGRIVEHLLWYGATAVPWVLAVPTVAGTAVDNVLWSALLGGVGIAGWLVLWRKWRAAALYIAAYIGLLVLWVWKVERFVVPLVPFLVTAILLGTGWLAQRVRPGWSTAAVLALAAVLIASGGARSMQHVLERRACATAPGTPPVACLTADQASYFAALRHVREALPEDARLLTAKTGALYLYTGRRALDFDAAVSRGPGLDYLVGRGATHVLLSHLHTYEWERLAPSLERICESLALEVSFPPRTYLFRIVTGANAGGGAACAAIAAYRRSA